MTKLNIKRLVIAAIVLAVVSIPVIGSLKASQKTSKFETNNLPVVGTIENFKKLMEEGKKYNSQIYGVMEKGAVTSQARVADSAQNGAKTEAPPSSDYSKTNVQVDGVDEADVVKTDGKYIYQVNTRKIVIARAYPAESMKIVSTIDFNDKNFYPLEIFVDDNYLTVIGTSFYDLNYEIPLNNKKVQNNIMPSPYYRRSTLKVMVYDIKDKENVKETRQAEIEGNYVSSRKIGSKLYLVSNKYLEYYLLEQGVKDITPAYRDSTSSNEFKNVGYDNIKYFPDTIYNNYMIIGSMDISTNNEIKIQTYLGAGQNIYVSNENLYAAVTKFDIQEAKKGMPEVQSKIAAVYPMNTQNTLIYKFALNSGDVTYKAKGEVPGSILNQFSMDEHNSYFRIATTSGSSWMRGSETSKNNIYVLDSNMTNVGKIEDIAPGEKIYSVRFMGDKGYLVTFETVDPLFVVDLKNPENPKILGALKIPGYSNYLHPYDENHIIGFGKDAVVLPVKDQNGKVVREQAYYMGMKIAIFDVTDVNHPVEMFSTQIGDRGTDSEILHNHKALLFSKEKNLLALPVSLFELKNGQSPVNGQYNHPEYGTFTFQGAYIYNIDLQKGFTLKGRITHISDEDYLKAGKYQYNGLNNVERILYINDTLYTLSKGTIKASRMDNLNSVGSINIPQDIKQ